MVVEFVIARNPDETSSLPFLIRLPVGRDLIALKVRETWPRTSKVYCHRADRSCTGVTARRLTLRERARSA